MIRQRFTWCDSGVLAGWENCAIDLAAKVSEEPAGHLRFHRFTPSVSLGAHENVDRAVRRQYCLQRRIEIFRRQTGGGALYHDEAQLCWTLSFRPLPQRLAGANLAYLLEKLCGSLVTALRHAGLNANFRAPNDIEVAGRKIACGFATADGPSLLFQGCLLLELDVESMLMALRVPTEKLSAQGMSSARQRLTAAQEQLDGAFPVSRFKSYFVEELGAVLGVDFVFSQAGPALGCGRTGMHTDVPANDTPPDALHAFLGTPGGVLYADVVLSEDDELIEWARISGSVQPSPSDFLRRVAHGITGERVGRMADRLGQVLHKMKWEIVRSSAEDLRYVIQLAIDKRREQRRFGVGTDTANCIMVHSPERDQSAEEILSTAKAMLIPYCTKPIWCKWRNRDGCSECGLCEVGEAYGLARERGMRVISINNYEHLCQTLQDLRHEKFPAYIGMCCENFYLKRRIAFDQAQLPAVLVNITGSNCYELQQEDRAYVGAFQAQAQLNMTLVRKLVACIPAAGTSKV